MSNPFLENTPNPNFSQITASNVVPATREMIKQYDDATDAMISIGIDDLESAIRRYEIAEFHYNRIWSRIENIHGVASDDEYLEAYSEALKLVTQFTIDQALNPEGLAFFQQIANHPDFDSLDDARKKLINEVMRQYKNSGAFLSEDDREIFKDLTHKLSEYTADFSNNVLKSTEAWTKHITNVEDLAGVPETGIALLKSYAEEKNLDGYLVTLKAPSTNLIYTYCENRALREEVYQQANTRASANFSSPEFDNTGIIGEMISIRTKLAKLLGFKNYAEMSIESKMAETTDQVMKFLDDLVIKAKPIAVRERKVMAEYAKERFGYDKYRASDSAFVSYWYQREKFNIDRNQIKKYFPVEQVLSGATSLFNELFGINLVARDVDTWHEDVVYYDVTNAQNEVIAGVYVDMFARDGKRAGAWMSDAQMRLQTRDEKFIPIANLVTNFAPPTGDIPALLSHDDVTTTLHEFGHVLHHLLTEVDVAHVGGISGVEWDAVELPSQFMENFAWDYKYLKKFSKHYETGEELPAELFELMKSVKDFNAGLAATRQLLFAKYDFTLHMIDADLYDVDYMEVFDEIQAKVSASPFPAWAKFPNAFSHIFSGGYSAGYYSYLWAEVLSADAYEIVQQDPSKIADFRNEILAVGGVRNSAFNFKSFAGREPKIDALLRSRGIV